MPSNAELVEAFIEASVRSKEILLSNKDFVAETVFGTNQLTCRKQGVIMRADAQQQPTQFLLREESFHFKWLQSLLIQHQYIDTNGANEKGFYRYQYFSLKPGYQVNRQSARMLWKTWRSIDQRKKTIATAHKLLIRNEHTWSEVKKISLSNELVFVETKNGEMMTHLNEDILWLSTAD